MSSIQHLFVSRIGQVPCVSADVDVPCVSVELCFITQVCVLLEAGGMPYVDAFARDLKSQAALSS